MKIVFLNVLLLLCAGLSAGEPLHEWCFNEGAGVSVTDSGSGQCSTVFYEGTAAGVNGPVFVNDPQRGEVLAFDGNDWLLTDSQGVTGAMSRTITAWIYLTADNYRHTIVQYGSNSPGQYFRLLIENRRLRFEVASGNALALEAGALSLGRWYHIALVVSDANNDGQVRTGDVRFYLDGINVPQVAGVDQLINTVYTDASSCLRIGGAAAVSGSATPREPLTGRLDNVRVFQEALSQVDIQLDMGQVVPDDQGVVDEWLFAENSGLFTLDTNTTSPAAGVFMDGTVASVAGPVWVSDPIRGVVLSFDGNDWIMTDTKAVLGGQPRSVTVWFCLKSLVSQQTIAQWGNASAGQYYRVMIEDQRLRLEVGSGNALALNTGDLALNRWYHLAVVADDINKDGVVKTSEVRFYLNGLAVAQTQGTEQTINTAFVNDNSYLHIGGAAPLDSSGTPRNGFIGMLDDLRIYNTGLNSTQILSDMAQFTTWYPEPEPGREVRVSADKLSWSGGVYAQMHYIYLGKDPALVAAATVSEHSGLLLAMPLSINCNEQGRYVFDLSTVDIKLEPLTDYYWRVDTYDNTTMSGSLWQGSVWHYRTGMLDLKVDKLSYSGNISDVTINWEPDIDIYEPVFDIALYSDKSLGLPLLSATTSQSSWKPDTSGLVFNKPYYCQVWAYDATTPGIRGASDVLEVYFKSPNTIDNFDTYEQTSGVNDSWQAFSAGASQGALALSYDADGESVILDYNIPGRGGYYGVVYSLLSDVDLHRWGTSVIQVFYRGLPDNSPAVLGIILYDSEGRSAMVSDPATTQAFVQEKWSPWSQLRMPLSRFEALGVNTHSINRIGIYVENNTDQPVTGSINIDDLSLDTLVCPGDKKHLADINSDCQVNATDLESWCSYWLRSGSLVMASENEPTGLHAYWSFDQIGSQMITDGSGNNYHGSMIPQVSAEYWSQDGKSNGCLAFNGDFAIEFPAGSIPQYDSDLTVAFWCRGELSDLLFDIELSDNYWNDLWVTIPDGNWNYICFSHNAGTQTDTIYVNGLSVATASSVALAGVTQNAQW
ncbi:MAG: LamG domain-containing protein, partial [Sedimentisphaerales bacterium]|nr:LamG domain-containing protein [Sedimentisphaerales bacterium]